MGELRQTNPGEDTSGHESRFFIKVAAHPLRALSEIDPEIAEHVQSRQREVAQKRRAGLDESPSRFLGEIGIGNLTNLS